MTLREKLKKGTVLLDGAFGTYIQSLGITDADFGEHPGCMENLSFTRPDIIRNIHSDYLEAGSDAVETNTFGANAIKLAEYGLGGSVFEINRAAARIARDAADAFSRPRSPRYVIGSIGPTGRLPSSSNPDLSDITYKELKNVFHGQAAGIIAGGADALLVETGQDILEMKAAANGAKEAAKDAGRDLVIMAQFTLANNGRMLLGTGISAAMATMANVGVDVIGINCSTGPAEMESAVRYLSSNCPVFISCLPNAGLPYEAGGKTVYPLGPEEMGVLMGRFMRDYRIDAVGGCCGTAPAHIREIRGHIGKTGKRKAAKRYFYAGSYEGYDLGGSPRPVIVGERLNAQGSRRMKELLLKGDYDSLVELGKDQERNGARMLDVSSVLSERSTEMRDAVILTKRLAESVKVPLMIDSTDADVIEAALCNYPGTAFINSVNLEDGGEKAGKVFAMAREHGSFVVALVIDEEGMAKTVEHKIGAARRLREMAVSSGGIAPDRLIFDMLTFSLATGEKEYADSAVNTFKAIKSVKKELKGVLTVLGVSNVSFGLAKQGRRILNAVFLYHASKAGLDLAIVNPAELLNYDDIHKKDRDIAESLLFNSSPEALNNFVEYFSAKVPADAEAVEEKELSAEEKIRKCVLDRDKAKIIPAIDNALKGMKPEGIINNVLLDVMREVGDKLESGELVLPYVLQSAEVMRKAVDHLDRFLPKDHARKRGTIVLATVFGDVHDIGKNLVKMILENNGFTVIDMGKQVPMEEVVREAKRCGADAVGLSALLVSTARYMKTGAQFMHDNGLSYPIIVGGAPVNKKFAGEMAKLDSGGFYRGGVFYAKDAFTGLKIMRALTDPEEKKRIMKEYAVGLGREDASLGVKESKRQSLRNTRDAIRNTRKVPVPPFYGVRSLVNIPADDVFGCLDERTLFNVAWGSRLADKVKKEKLLEKEYRPLLNELKEESIRKGWLDLKAAYGYFKCRVTGNDMRILGEDASSVIETISFTREGAGDGLCLTDYFARNDGAPDLVVFQAVTVGERIGEVLEKMARDKEYSRMFFLHGLSVHLAEAVAAYMHGKIRMELKLKPGQGKRYSPGYPLWNNLEDQKKIFRILEVEKRLGIRLTESCQMVPEQSTTAMIVYDDGAEYRDP